MTLDLAAARAVARARVFERAVNDPGPWTIRIGDVSVPAVRIRTRSRLMFVAHFDDPVEQGEDVAWLLCRGDELSSMLIAPSPERFVVEWSFHFPTEELQPV